MSYFPLVISSLLDHAATCHGETEIVTRLVEGGLHRSTYRAVHRRARQVAQALRALGVVPGDRIGTLAWNTHRHFELCYGVAGCGAVWHTLNPRLFRDQIVYIINHAQDRCVFFDLTFLPLVDAVAPLCPQVATWVAMTDADHRPRQRPDILCYETMLEEQDGDFAWPALDELSAAGLCYTSGTTGNPKGVLYSHRSTVLHAYAISLPDTFGFAARDVVMPVAPMYHANAWGLPYAAPLVGAKLVLPGPALDGHSLWELCEKEGVTFSNGVPTIWQSLLDFLRESGQRLRLPHRSLIGGAAPSPSLLAALEDEYGVELRHGWGMTEISPVGLVNVPKTAETAEQKSRRRVKQGRPVPGIEVKIVDEQGADLPWDGSSFGCLLVRGHWVCSAYFAERADIFRDGGWLVTGDMATIDRDGYVQIVDRAKDIIKSGGEWISSVDLENLACGHPEVQEAAAIGVPDEKWGERPLLIVVRRPGGLLDGPGMIEHLRGRVAKWWLPDRVLFVPSLPRTATGKISKARLRADYAAPAAGPGPTVA